ncbi:zinc finger protein [Loa loa]|uniref:Zinc finger protein n=1 Tax=Loa loa TaxID=7209 RepID=A0A1S0UKT4_LOALO|nr:zinc finger protein [Loa loa]EJD76036.1 zinc finger protein [Loa loa]
MFLGILGASDSVITDQRTYLLGNTINSRSSSNGSGRQIDTMNMSKNYGACSGNSYQSQQHYVPVRSSFRSPSTTERKSNRSSSKKEPMDPKNVEEEVARNVSQILSASLNQKSLSSGFTSTTGASGANGQSSISTTGASVTSTTTAKKSFTCVDCHKTVSTSRNLQRHRMSCKLAQASSNPGKSLTTAAGQLQATVITMPLNSAQINGLSSAYSADQRSMNSATANSISTTNVVSVSCNNNLITSLADTDNVSSVNNLRTTQIYSTPSEMIASDERLRPVCEESYLDKAVAEMTRNGDLNTATAGRLASSLLDEDDHSFSTISLPAATTAVDNSHPFQSPVQMNNEPVNHPTFTQQSAQIKRPGTSTQLYRCESCNKTVSSSRSLKRHRSTCKQYQLEYGQLRKKAADNMSPTTDSRSKPILLNSSVTALPSAQEQPLLQRQSLACIVTELPVVSGVISSTSCSAPTQSEVEVTSVESGIVQNLTSSDGTAVPGTSVSANVCEDCNRILCSASNLKRHRATCKMASMLKSGSTKLRDQHSAAVLATSLSTTVAQQSNDQVDEREHAILDRSCAASLVAPKEAMPRSVLVAAGTVDTATYSNASTNATHQRSGSDASLTYITYDTVNVTPLQQQQQITTAVQPVSQLESLKLGAAKAKPWITVGEHLRARHNQRIIQQRQQQRESVTPSVPETLGTYGKAVTVPLPYTDDNVSARLRQQIPGSVLMYSDNSVGSGDQSSNQLGLKHNTPKQLSYYTRVHYDGDSGIITCGTYDQQQRRNSFKMEEPLLSPQNTSARASAPPILTTTTPTNYSGTTQAQLPKNEKCEARPLASIITTAPLSTSCSATDSNQSQNQQSTNSALFTTPVVYGTMQPQQPPPSTSSTVLYRNNENMSSVTDNYRYECPECQKTYSCRKNVKRHRIAVHKLTPEEVAKIEPIRVLLTNDSEQKQQRLQQRQRQLRLLQTTEIKGVKSPKLSVEKSDMQEQQHHSSDFGNCTNQSMPNVVLSEQMHLQIEQRQQQLHQRQLQSQLQLQQTQLQEQQQIISGSDHCRDSAAVTSVIPVSTSWTSCITAVPPSASRSIGAYRLSGEEDVQLAEIEEDLKRSAEYKLTEADSESDNRRPVAELAEADTTFHEEYEDNIGRLHPSHPPSLSSNGGVVSPPSNPPSNSSVSSNYPITSPMAPQVSSVIPENGGFAAQLPPIKAPPPLSPSHSSQQMAVVQNRGMYHQSQPRISSNSSQTSNPVSMGGNTMFTKPANVVRLQYLSSTRPPSVRNYFHSSPKQKQHICVDCNRALSSDYSLKRHRSTCVEAKAAAAAKAVDIATAGADMRNDECAKILPEHYSDSCSSRSSSMLSNEPTVKESSCINVSSYGSNDSEPRVSQQLTPVSAKNTDVMLPQTYCYDEDADNGVLCRVCDCWLPGQREFDRHCDELHPVAADPDSTTVPQTFEQTSLASGSIMLSTAISSEVSLNPSGPYSVAATNRKRVSSDPLESGSYFSTKSGRHLCQTCGKYYSSEWNLERHRRESCPSHMKRLKSITDERTRLAKLEPVDLLQFQTTVNTRWVDDCALIVGESRIGVPRAMLSRASTYFSSLFQYYENHSDVPLPVPVDPIAFHQAMEAFKGRLQLDGKNIDCILFMADKFKIKPLYDRCERFIAEKLPSSSVMHAIRLAEQYRMCEIKQALFDSISIDVFRSLAADEDYRQMGAELKAELLEKWGTFL